MKELSLRIITSLIAGSIFFGVYFLLPPLFPLLLIAILLFILIIEWPRLFSIYSLKFWVIMPFYPILPIISLIYIFCNFYDVNILIPLFPFVSAWTYDSTAYIVGKLIGKHKICPKISPGKTYEGLIGGFLGMLALNWIVFLNGSNIIFILSVSIILALLAFFGDLFESYLKRNALIKDSGKLLPGHGGLLDRFDSVFFIAIFLGIFLVILDYQTKQIGNQIYAQVI